MRRSEVVGMVLGAAAYLAAGFAFPAAIVPTGREFMSVAIVGALFGWAGGRLVGRARN